MISEVMPANGMLIHCSFASGLQAPSSHRTGKPKHVAVFNQKRNAMKWCKAGVIVPLFLFSLVADIRADEPPLIPRDILFGNPERASPELSPDGKFLAYLAPDDKNVLQVFLR